MSNVKEMETTEADNGEASKKISKRTKRRQNESHMEVRTRLCYVLT